MLNILRALRLLKAGKFDLVHCNSTVSLEAAIAAKMLGIPVVIHCRELLRDNPTGFFGGWKLAYRIVEHLADKVICISKAVHQQMLEAGCRPKNIVVIYDGFEMADIHPAPLETELRTERGTSSHPIIGCVAGIHPRKGHPTLLRAFSIVKRSIPNVRLVIVGDGMASYVDKIKALASRLGIDRATQFVGEVRDVGSYYRQFVALAVPSFAEGFGLVYIEAAIYGIPAIGTSDGGASEIIEDGVTGFIVAPDNPEKLAKVMLTILENPKLAKEMGKCAKESVLNLFSPEKHIKGIENLYRELLDRQT
jgi:glycosyltransferase involved in cell wall biosynthesis